MAMSLIGQLRQRIELQSAVDTVDDYGQSSRTWTTYATVWAQVQTLNGSEPKYAGALNPIAGYLVSIRYRSDILPTHKIIYGSKTLNITSCIDPEGTRIWTKITADEAIQVGV